MRLCYPVSLCLCGSKKPGVLTIQKLLPNDSLKLNYLVFHNRKNVFIVFWFYHSQSRKTAECRQYRIPPPKIKTRKTQRLPPLPVHPYARMNMAGKEIIPNWRFRPGYMCDVVNEMKVLRCQFFSSYCNTSIAIPVI